MSERRASGPAYGLIGAAVGSDHLLRTLAAVSPTSEVLDLGSERATHAEALTRLGFRAWTCLTDADDAQAVRDRLAPLAAAAAERVIVASPDALGFPDDAFDWVVGSDLGDPGAWASGFEEVRRVLRQGGWFWVLVPLSEGERVLELATETGFALSEPPGREGSTDQVHVIFRKPGRDTIG